MAPINRDSRVYEGHVEECTVDEVCNGSVDRAEPCLL